MTPTLLDFSPQNPFRDPDWRWRRVRHLLATGRNLSRRRDDEWVRRCHRFLVAHSACDGPASFHELAGHYPGLYWAHDLYSGKDQGPNRLLGYMLEARLLADQAWPAIATRTGLPAEVVEAYHECFFEVRPHLMHTDYLMAKVVGESVYRGLRDRNYDLLWKLFAIWGGEHAVETLISTFIAPSKPSEAASMGAFIQDAVRGKLALKAMAASQSVEVNNYTAVELLTVYLKQVEIEKKAGEGGGGQAAIVQTLGGVLRSLPFAAGRAPSESFERTPTRVNARLVHDASAVELNGDELFRLGAGEVIEVDDRPLPPPPPRAITDRSK